MTEWDLFWRTFRAERWPNVLIVLVATVGFTIYAFLASWNHAALRGQGLRVEPPGLPADVLVLTPAWLQDAVRPDMSLRTIARMPEIGGDGTQPGDARAASTALSLPVLTSAGTVRAWGVDPGDAELLRQLRILAGRADLAAGVLVSSDFARATGSRVGSALRLSAIGRDDVLHTLTVRIAGVYDAGGPVLQALVMPKATLSRLTGYTEDNALFLWQAPIEAGRSVRGLHGLTSMKPLREVVPAYLNYTRAPRMPWDFAPANPIDRFAGAPLPFGFLTGQFMIEPGIVRSTVLGTTEAANRNLTPVAMALFALMAVAITILQVIRVLDVQRNLGILKALGDTPREILRLYGLGGAVDMALAIVLARGLFQLLADILGREHALRLAFFPGTYLVWLPTAALFALWAGKVPSILAHSTPTRSLLHRASEFDWLALIRF